jgi:ABC-type transporter Mla subunit MlaD
MDLGRVRVDKWKTEGNVKDQTRGNIESLQKNLTAALPGLMEQVQTNPSHVGAVVKLYRNLNVVYDVLSSVAESTGAFGAKDDYQALATDVANLDTVRRNIADQLEQMASAQDAAYAQLVNQARAQQQAAATAAPPTKVIVDDEAPVKKTTAKKKKKPAPSAAAAETPKSQ